MSSGTKKVEAPEISSGSVVGKVRKSESRKSKRIGKRKEDLYSGELKTKNRNNFSGRRLFNFSGFSVGTGHQIVGLNQKSIADFQLET